jgi:tetratricopeptide (TPR) repeat protein
MNSLEAEALYKAGLKEVTIYVRRKAYQNAIDRIVIEHGWRLKAEFRFNSNHSWYMVGDMYEKLGRLDSAISAFRRALRSWPENADAFWAIADCYSAKQRYKFAERFYRRALDLNADSDELIFNLGNALLDQNRFHEAIKMYKRVSKKSPSISAKAKTNTDLAVIRLQGSRRS